MKKTQKTKTVIDGPFVKVERNKATGVYCMRICDQGIRYSVEAKDCTNLAGALNQIITDRIEARSAEREKKLAEWFATVLDATLGVPGRTMLKRLRLRMAQTGSLAAQAALAERKEDDEEEDPEA